MATISADTGVNYVISAKDVSRAAIDSAVAGTKRVQTATERMTNHTREHLQRYRGYYLAAAAAVTAAGAAIAKSSIGQYAEFEKELANVSTLVDTSEVSMAGLQRQILTLNPNLGSAAELTRGLYQALSAGVDPAKSVAFIAQAAVAAKAGLSDTFTAVDSGTTILNAFGLEIERATEVYDLMFATVKEGKTTFEELAAAEAKISPIAAAANVSIYEQHAALATLTKGGFKTTEASSRLATALGAIIKPSSEAAKMAAELGLQFDAQALKARGLHGFLQDVKMATGGNVEKMAQLFGGMESLSVMLALTGKQSKEFTDILERMKNTSGAADEAFNKQKWTLSSLWETFKNIIGREAILLGAQLAPALKDVLEKTTAWIEANRELINQRIDVTIDSIASSIGRIYSIYQKIPDGLILGAGLGLVGAILFGSTGAAVGIAIGVATALEKAVMKIEIVRGWVDEAQQKYDSFVSQYDGLNATPYHGKIPQRPEGENGASPETNMPAIPEDKTLDIMSQRFQEIENLQLNHFQVMKGFEDEYTKIKVSNAIWLAQKIQQIEKETVSYKQRSAQAQYATAVALGQALLNFAGVNSQAIFLITQAFEFARAIVCAHIAAAQALATPPGPPYTVPLAKAILAWGYWNAGMIAAQAVATYAASGNSAASGLSSSLGSPYVAIEDTDTISETETSGGSTESTLRSLTVNVYNYGYMGDADGIARELVPAIRKAERDGV